MARVQVNVDSSRLVRELRASFSKLTTVAAKSVRTGLREFESRFVREHLSGPGSDSTLKRRSGTLAKSLHVEVRKTSPTQVTGSIFFQGGGAVYAPTHEFGATIRAKNRKYLTIPLPAALTPAGVPKGKARDFREAFFRVVRGNLFLVQRVGRDTVPLFLLKESVKIPPRLKFRESFRAFEPQILRRVDEAITETFGT